MLKGTSELLTCPGCSIEMQSYLQPWMCRCLKCGYEGSHLDKEVFQSKSLLGWDEEAERSMEPLRAVNAGKILDTLDRLKPVSNARLLDVGCAAGWFLSAASRRGMKVRGIEPDPYMGARAREIGHDVIEAAFPEPGLSSDSFDVVSFNDVFEHLHDLTGIMREVDRVLAANGLLVLSLPSSKGFIYRIATVMCRLRMSRFVDRLWQKGYESPHLHYFDDHSLQQFANQHGFSLQARRRLASLTLRGLRERVREDSEGARFLNFAVVNPSRDV